MKHETIIVLILWLWVFVEWAAYHIYPMYVNVRDGVKLAQDVKKWIEGNRRD